MKSNKQVNRLFAIVLFAIMLVIIFVIDASAQIKTGYLVSVDYKDKMIVREVRTVEQAENILDNYFKKSKIDVTEFLKGGIHFELWSCDMRVYVELKKIVNGKYRRLRRKDIKELGLKSK